MKEMSGKRFGDTGKIRLPQIKASQERRWRKPRGEEMMKRTEDMMIKRKTTRYQRRRENAAHAR